MSTSPVLCVLTLSSSFPLQVGSVPAFHVLLLSVTRVLPPPDPQPLPPPLPKKTLTRARSLHTHRAASSIPNSSGQASRPLLGFRSMGESQTGNDKTGPAGPPAELPFCSLDTELGLSFHNLQCLQVVHAAPEAWHWRASAGCMAGSKSSSWRATGPLPPGHSLHLLDSSASVQSRDTLY